MQKELPIEPVMQESTVVATTVFSLHTGRDTFRVVIHGEEEYRRFLTDLNSFYEKGIPAGGVYGDDLSTIAVNFKHVTFVEIVD